MARPGIQSDEIGKMNRLLRFFDNKTDERTFLLDPRHGTKAEIARKSELPLGVKFDCWP